MPAEPGAVNESDNHDAVSLAGDQFMMGNLCVFPDGSAINEWGTASTPTGPRGEST
jgi:hypothetical protein